MHFTQATDVSADAVLSAQLRSLRQPLPGSKGLGGRGEGGDEAGEEG